MDLRNSVEDNAVDDEEVTFKPRGDRIREFRRRRNEAKKSDVAALSEQSGKENVENHEQIRLDQPKLKDISGREKEVVTSIDKAIRESHSRQSPIYSSRDSNTITAMELATPILEKNAVVKMDLATVAKHTATKRLDFSDANDLILSSGKRVETLTSSQQKREADSRSGQQHAGDVRGDSTAVEPANSERQLVTFHLEDQKLESEEINESTEKEHNSLEASSDGEGTVPKDSVHNDTHAEDSVPKDGDDCSTAKDKWIEEKTGQETAIAEVNSSLDAELESMRLELEKRSNELTQVKNDFTATVHKLTIESEQTAAEEQSLLKSENEKLQEELRSNSAAFSSLKQRYGKFKDAIIKYDAQEKELISQIRTLKKTLLELEKWNKDFKQHAEKKLEEAFEQACAYRNQAKEKSAEADKLIAEGIDLKDSLDAVQKAKQELEVKVQSLAAEVAELRQTVHRLNRSGQSLSESKQIEDRLTACEEENKALKVKMFDSMQLMEALRKERDDERTAKTALEKQNNELQTLCDELFLKLEV
ncbi:hypothetical protein NDN08_003117 [Rhodosorus marinus]|uniref:Transforming acidic coiled-coil-containing protein C-terminal domain-containing protein n=1 Tax=Rhodosorus marinus TaxID=101924 RepID=A0AAV8UX40_9RHOD|nr:hypothetical protein NDN08_003117 [Rhodosorus marinus]